MVNLLLLPSFADDTSQDQNRSSSHEPSGRFNKKYVFKHIDISSGYAPLVYEYLEDDIYGTWQGRLPLKSVFPSGYGSGVAEYSGYVYLIA